MTHGIDIEAELVALARARTWRFALGGLFFVFALIAPVVAWVLGVLEAFGTIANEADPTPDQLSDALLGGALWGLGLAVTFLVAGTVAIVMGVACDRRLRRFRRQLDELA